MGFYRVEALWAFNLTNLGQGCGVSFLDEKSVH